MITKVIKKIKWGNCKHVRDDSGGYVNAERVAGCSLKEEDTGLSFMEFGDDEDEDFDVDEERRKQDEEFDFGTMMKQAAADSKRKESSQG